VPESLFLRGLRFQFFFFEESFAFQELFSASTRIFPLEFSSFCQFVFHQLWYSLWAHFLSIPLPDWPSPPVHSAALSFARVHS